MFDYTIHQCIFRLKPEHLQAAKHRRECSCGLHRDTFCHSPLTSVFNSCITPAFRHNHIVTSRRLLHGTTVGDPPDAPTLTAASTRTSPSPGIHACKRRSARVPRNSLARTSFANSSSGLASSHRRMVSHLAASYRSQPSWSAKTISTTS